MITWLLFSVWSRDYDRYDHVALIRSVAWSRDYDRYNHVTLGGCITPSYDTTTNFSFEKMKKSDTSFLDIGTALLVVRVRVSFPKKMGRYKASFPGVDWNAQRLRKRKLEIREMMAANDD